MTTTLMELVITLVIGSSLLVGGVEPTDQAFWVTMLATLVTTTFLNYILVSFLLTPLRDISMAITTAAGQEPTDQPTDN